MHKLIVMVAALLAVAAAPLAYAHDDDRRGRDDDKHRGRDKPIAECGTVIEKPGTYYLAKDLLGCAGNAIEIRSSKVELELRGHAITAGGNLDGAGIRIFGGVAGLHSIEIKGPGVVHGFNRFPGTGIVIENLRRSEVRGVTITGNFFGMGVNRFFDSTGAVFGTESRNNEFRRLQILGNVGHGITSNGGNQNLYERNLLSRNGDHGLLLFDAVGNRVRNNIINMNGTGIRTVNGIGLDNDIRDNIALGNGTDLFDENPACDGNTWTGNTFGTSVPSNSCVE